MAMRDNEKQILADIEHRLCAENPRLAQRFSQFRAVRLSTLVASGLGALMLLSTGLVAMVIGAQLARVVLVVVGAVITTAILAGIGWFLRWSGSPPFH